MAENTMESGDAAIRRLEETFDKALQSAQKALQAAENARRADLDRQVADLARGIVTTQNEFNRLRERMGAQIRDEVRIEVERRLEDLQCARRQGIATESAPIDVPDPDQVRDHVAGNYAACPVCGLRFEDSSAKLAHYARGCERPGAIFGPCVACDRTPYPAEDVSDWRPSWEPSGRPLCPGCATRAEIESRRSDRLNRAKRLIAFAVLGAGAIYAASHGYSVVTAVRALLGY